MDVAENTASCESKMVPGNFLVDEAAAAFGANFLDEDTCRRWILASIYRDRAISCPECSAPLTEKGLQRFRQAERVRCPACGKFFTAYTDTFLQGCHLTTRQIMLLAVFLHFGIHPEIIATKVGVSTETVRLWQKKFRAIQQIRDIER